MQISSQGHIISRMKSYRWRMYPKIHLTIIQFQSSMRMRTNNSTQENTSVFVETNSIKQIIHDLFYTMKYYKMYCRGHNIYYFRELAFNRFYHCNFILNILQFYFIIFIFAKIHMINSRASIFNLVLLYVSFILFSSIRLVIYAFNSDIKA